MLGIIIGGITLIILLTRLFFIAPIALLIIVSLGIIIVLGRPYLLKRMQTDDQNSSEDNS